MDFAIGQRVSWQEENRRVSGVIYDQTPAFINSMGIPRPQRLCVTLRFGRNHQNVVVDADVCRQAIKPNTTP